MNLAEFKRRIKEVDRVRMHVPLRQNPEISTYVALSKKEAVETVFSTIGSPPRMRVKFPRSNYEALWLNTHDGEEVTP